MTERGIPRRIARGLCILLGMLAGYTLHADSAEAEYLDRGVQGCLMCHGADSSHPAEDVLTTVHAVRGDARTPMGAEQKACEACHGPSADHVTGQREDGGRPLPAVAFTADESASHKDATCLGCHDSDTGPHWHGSVHQFEEVACVDCHQLHPRQDPVMARSSQVEVCTDCHRRERAEILRPSSHPLRRGNMVCTECHQPHGGIAEAALIRPSVNATCYECHAEHRGPFLWEHAPVTEDCTTCHTPHGSSHRNLLVRRTPWMCQECHLSQFHPSTAESGLGTPERGGASRQILGRDCLNCHTQVHGSNHPSGAGLIR